MTMYQVNATVSVAAWFTTEAETPEEALDFAREASASEFEVDMGTAEVDFNVTPEVEPA